MKGIKITTDNIISLVEIKSNGKPLYNLMHDIMGGYYENVYPRRLKKGYVMIVNEEGLLKGLPLNVAGCYLYQSDLHGYAIVGDIFILKLSTYQGEADVVGMTDEEADTIVNELMSKVKGLKKQS